MTGDLLVRMIKPKRFALLFVTILIFGAISPASCLRVTGAVLLATTTPGEQFNFHIDVGLGKNDTPANFSLDVNDWKQSLMGDNDAVANNPGLYSAKDLLTVSPQSFHLDPNSSQIVTVGAIIPADAKPGGRYAIISIHNAPEKNGTSKYMVNNQFAVESLVAITISESDTQKQGEISNLTISEPVSAKLQNLSLIFNNTGNIHYKVLTEAALKDKDGKILANASVPLTSSILPGAARLIEFSFKPESQLKSGTYTAEAMISLEDGTVLAKRDTHLAIKS